MERSKKRISSRDQAIRRKYQPSPGKASKSSPGPSLPKIPAKPGSVLAMYPSTPKIISVTEPVVGVARAMAGNKTDAVLVVDSSQKLVGIVTDKDLAFRCVAEGLDALRTPVSTIMTKHLPVVDETKIVGLLDITKVVEHIQRKIDNSWGKADALKTAFTEFQSSWSNFANNPEVEKWFEDWSSKMVEPDLNSVLDPKAVLPEVGYKTSVRDAARVMKDCKTTAVLVCDTDHELAGIFTTKDICLRVLAPNEVDPKSTSVVRVMTPHPDTGLDTMTIKSALKKMHDGHYLHLPVRAEKTGQLIGLVDVLNLTYKTIDILIKQQSLLPQKPSEGDDEIRAGPMWSQFWTGADLDEPGDQSFEQDTSTHRLSSRAPSSFGGMVGVSDYRPRDVSTSRASDSSFGGDTFVFKFRDPFSGTVHRFTHAVRALEDLQSLEFIDFVESLIAKCGHLLATDKAFTQDEYENSQMIKAKKKGSENEFVYFKLSYRDEEGDNILLLRWNDLVDAVNSVKDLGWQRLVLVLEAFYEEESGVKSIVNLEKQSSLLDLDDSINNSALDLLDKAPKNEPSLNQRDMIWMGVGILGLTIAGTFILTRLINK